MIQDKELVNGKYLLFYNPKNEKTILGVSEALYVLTSKMARDNNSKIKRIGEISFLGENSASYHFDFEDAHVHPERSERNSKYILGKLASAFQKKGGRDVIKTLDSHCFEDATRDGVLADIGDKFDFEYKGGLYQLSKNLIVNVQINMIQYNGESKATKGMDLDKYEEVSRRFHDEKAVRFDSQFYGFSAPTSFQSFRDTPGSSGWDCDVMENGGYHGVKYHRINESKTMDYSFANGIGSIKCANGILVNADRIHFLSIEDTIKKIEKQESFDDFL